MTGCRALRPSVTCVITEHLAAGGNMIIRTFVITLPEKPERREKAMAHFKERGIHAYQFFNGLHAEKAGLSTVHPYEVDHPGSGFRMGFAPTGIWLAHVMLWSVLNFLHDDHYLILEDDARFPEDWHGRYTEALRSVPGDFDMLYVGSCCCKGRPTTHIKGEVFEVKYPQCTHAYIVAKKAIPLLLARHRKCWAPIDIALMLESHEHLKVYTVLPRIVEQFNTEILP